MGHIVHPVVHMVVSFSADQAVVRQVPCQGIVSMDSKCLSAY